MNYREFLEKFRPDADFHLYYRWRRAVLKLDGKQCAWCRRKGKTDELHADHILSWARFVELRYDPRNGRTLCRDCHGLRHQQGGILIPRDADCAWVDRRKAKMLERARVYGEILAPWRSERFSL